MKIFNKIENWQERVNFVDENNVVLGYDMDQQCCETAGWFISDKIMGEPEISDMSHEGITEIQGFVFDTEFLRKEEEYSDYYEGGVVIFRIYKDSEELYVHLTNCHNGYYSHGFQLIDGYEVKQAGNL